MHIPSLSPKPLTAALGRQVAVAALAACSFALASGHASAAQITINGPIAVPSTFDGLYINLATGATGGTAGSVPGWDFNPYNSGTSLSFFWSASPSQASGVASTTTGPYLDLAPGAIISAASTFAQVTASTATAQFQSPGNHVLGFRFFNEGTSSVNYGYMVLTSGGTGGFPLTIQSWTYENAGTSIAVVPEPASALMLAAGVAALGAVRARRQRRSGT